MIIETNAIFPRKGQENSLKNLCVKRHAKNIKRKPPVQGLLALLVMQIDSPLSLSQQFLQENASFHPALTMGVQEQSKILKNCTLIQNNCVNKKVFLNNFL